MWHGWDSSCCVAILYCVRFTMFIGKTACGENSVLLLCVLNWSRTTSLQKANIIFSLSLDERIFREKVKQRHDFFTGFPLRRCWSVHYGAMNAKVLSVCVFSIWRGGNECEKISSHITLLLCHFIMCPREQLSFAGWWHKCKRGTLITHATYMLCENK